MEQIGETVLAAILVANGELSLHVERFPHQAACRARIEELKTDRARIHHVDCTLARDLGLAGGAAPSGTLAPGDGCFEFNGERVCD